jgi:PucR C-terminal helix-turn-helix domain/GGDEF-like domain
MICPPGQRPRRLLDRDRADIAARLEARRPEIEETILARAHAVASPSGAEDAEYLEGLRAAVTAAVGYCLLGIERGEERAGSLPAAMLAQARQAARNRVGLETVLRRYFAGYTVLGDFLVQEARDGSLQVEPSTFFRAQKEFAVLFDRIVASVSAEYRQEAEHALRPREERTAMRVKRLLAGEPLDTSEFDYDFEAHHLGVIATGSRAQELLRELASRLDRRLLLIGGAQSTIWAWLGARRPLDVDDLTALQSMDWPDGVSLAIGEPSQGLRGWRLTHRQAEAAQRVALRRPQPLTRYADVALLAAVLRDDDLIEFLTKTFLVPLTVERDGGEALRQTLHAFFAAGRHVSSAATTLGIARQTVTSRLRMIEERIDRSLDVCGVEIETALRLGDLDSMAPSDSR